MLRALSEVSLVRNLIEFEFAQIALLCTFFVSVLCGFLSPVVVLKNRSYIGDTLAHLVFPGVICGFFVSEVLGLPLWFSLFVGAATSGLIGTLVSDFILKVLHLPQDSAAVVTLTGFFGAGVIAVSRFRGTRIDLDRYLFGDVLTLEWSDAAILGIVCFGVGVSLVALRKHWDCWLSDPEFAEIAGFKVKLVGRLFPVLVTLAVLTGMFAVGGLMMSALLTLPAVLRRPHSVISVPAIASSIGIGLAGLLLAFQFDWPVGSAIVVFGFLLVLMKALVLKAKA